jgi:hypothetical protein
MAPGENNLPLTTTPIIYYLLQDGEVVYVGASTKNLYGRLDSHLKTKKFNEIRYEECPRRTLFVRERAQIRLYRPLYNIVGLMPRRVAETHQDDIRQYEIAWREKNDKALRKERALKRIRGESQKHKDFQKILKQRRQQVISAGFKPSTVSMWINGKRTPLWEHAVKLSILLDLPINKVPYRKVEVNQ